MRMPGNNCKVRAFSQYWSLGLGQRFTAYIDDPFRVWHFQWYASWRSLGSIGLPASLGSLGRVALAPWKLVLCVWEEVLAAWEVLSSRGLPAWEAKVLTTWGSVIPAWEELTAWGLTVWGQEALAAWAALSSWELPAWGTEVLAAWGLALPAQGLIRETALNQVNISLLLEQ